MWNKWIKERNKDGIQKIWIALGLFDTEKKQYRRTEFTGLMEITSLVEIFLK